MQDGPEPFQARMDLLSPMLRRWFEVGDDQELWHRVHITSFKDPVTKQMLYCVAQVGPGQFAWLAERAVMYSKQANSSCVGGALQLHAALAVWLSAPLPAKRSVSMLRCIRAEIAGILRSCKHGVLIL